jgi:4-amino-4-deoxy-L-arabinose transferase-like glycosyltransferase
LFSTSPKRIALLLVSCGALLILYFFGLTRTGLLGPDEPRYAAIGQAMAQTGDWITPRLWGRAWFEKPPLLYWMTSAAFKAGLGEDLAPRLPVAFASVAFLVYFFFVLRREYSERVALYATTILATSAGWLAYSHVAVPDLPMSVAFAASMLTVMRGTESSSWNWLTAGVLLGLAILAKGLVPLVLFLPALWFQRRQVRYLLLVFLAAAAVSAPWYVLVTLRSGGAFVDDFFWKQQFARFTSGEFLHDRPFWFYAPVLAAGLFPWSPFLLLLFSKSIYKYRHAAFLLAWFASGFLFFSISRGKLPGYLLPLLPPVAALLGIAIHQAERSTKMVGLMAATAALLGLVPIIQDLLPQALVSGLTRSQIHVSVGWLLPAVIAIVTCVLLERTNRRAFAIALVSLFMTVSVLRMVEECYPLLDREVSARSRWISGSESITCVPDSARPYRYGLDYYARRDLPDCN